METNVRYTVAGVFVLTLIAGIIFSVIWLSGGFSSREYAFYKVYMTESVSGLNLDAPVEFNGVNVGTVFRMRINKRNPQLVELLLRIQQRTPVTRGTRAKLGMRALSGVGYMLLEDKGTDMQPLLAEAGQTYPVIPTTPSILVRLESMLVKFNESFTKLSHSIESVLDEENLRTFKKFLHSGQGTMHMLESQTLPSAKQAAQQIEQTARDISKVSQEIKANPSVLIRGKQERPPGPGE